MAIDNLSLQALLNGAIPQSALIASRQLNFQKTDLPFLLNDVLFVPEGSTAVLIALSGKVGGASEQLTINLNNADSFSVNLNFQNGIDRILILGNEEFFKTLIFEDLSFDGNLFALNVMYF